jgi:hypothetical protein
MTLEPPPPSFVQPQWSFASPSRRRPVPLSEMLRDLWAWLHPRPQTRAERIREARAVAKLAAELDEAEDSALGGGDADHGADQGRRQ